MRIACPTCDATYEVPDKLIGTGRRLRCAKCEHEWLVEPESPGAPPSPLPALPAALPGDAVPPPMVEPRRPVPAAAAVAPDALAGRGGGRFAPAALWAAWIGSGVLLLAMGAGAWIYRHPIVEAWPPAARLYLLFGAA